MLCATETKKPRIDEAKAQQAIDFIESLTHTTGQWAGQPFHLMPWQRKIIYELFGTVKENGYRQYNTAYIEIPKKNGKSELAAAIALLLLFADNEPGAEIYGAAADRDQAGIVFHVAAQMVRNSPALMKRCRILDSVKRIVVYGTGSVYRVLSSDVKTKHGFNTHGVIFDELHTQPNRKLYEVLTKGSGDARRQPLFFLITTAGIDRNSVCWEQHEKARQILAGIIEDPTFYPVIYGPPDDEAGKDWDWENEENWYKVNPSLGQIITIDKVRDAFREAKRKIEEENTFKQLRLNIWVKQSTRWIKLSDWDKCVGKVDLEELKGRECYSAIDLSTSLDLTALAHVFPFEDNFYKILMRFWIPEATAAEKEKRDRVPYTRWIREGFVKTTPGNLIDYKFIQHQLNEDRTVFGMKELAYDPWGGVKLITDLQEDGFVIDEKLASEGHPVLVPFRQGYKSMSPPAKELINFMLNCKLEHGNNPVLRWNADNAVIEQDPAGNIKPDKAKATQRIDGIVAVIMALDRAIRHAGETGPSIYETRGMREL